MQVEGFTALVSLEPKLAAIRVPAIPNGNDPQIDSAIALVKQKSAALQVPNDQKIVLLRFLGDLYSTSARAVEMRIASLTPKPAPERLPQPTLIPRPMDPRNGQASSNWKMEDAIAAARQVRDNAVKSAGDLFRAAAVDAFRKAELKRRSDFTIAVETYDVRVKEITKTGDLDKALSVRSEKQQFVSNASRDGERAVKQWEALTGLSADSLIAAPDHGDSVPQRTVSLEQRVRQFFAQNPSLKTAGKLEGEIAWNADAGGYALAGTVQVGNCSENDGGKSFAGNLTVQPGFHLTGGVLRASAGSIVFKGTADRPIVLSGVRIQCEYNLTIKAEHTVFDACTFEKAGWYCSPSGSNSKWAFTDCVLDRCEFPYFGRMDYGLKLSRCDFLQCHFPERHWGYQNIEKPSDDGASLVRSEWSDITNCSFFNCRVAPSVVWVTKGCDFSDCQVTGKDEFASRTSLDVAFGVPAGDPFAALLASDTTHSGEGTIRYQPTVLPDGLGFRSDVWKWALKQ